MKELSLNILDIAQNSLKARATKVAIEISETDDTLSFTVTDNGCGMTEDFLRNVTDPFTTTRTTRKVGLGLPLLKMQSELTGGEFSITSKSEDEHSDHGTTVSVSFNKNSIDYLPLGDITGTVCVLVQGIGDVDLTFRHKMPEGEVALSTEEMREMLGDGIPLDLPEVIVWVKDFLAESYSSVKNLN
jgi:hypothetical protein